MNTGFREVQRCMHVHLYRSFKVHLHCIQLLFIAPCLDRSPIFYFKQARLLMTTGTLAWIAICGYQAIAELIEVPMPFFTGVLYVNEVVLCVFISMQTMSRGYIEAQRYKQFMESIYQVAVAIPCTEWTEVLVYLRVKLLWICTIFGVIFSMGLLFDYLHFGSFYSTLFTLGAYLLPNTCATISLAQYYAGAILIYKLQEKINQHLSSGKAQVNLTQTKHLYLRLDSCFQLITRSYEMLIVTNVFAGINVTSLQLLEIYQYLQSNDSDPIYLAYNGLWILLQLFMLLMVLFPSEMIKREQTRFGTILFEGSHQHESSEMAEDQQLTRLRMLTLGRKKIVATACGVLKLELSSLSSIFVALLSFMIILIQFDSAKLNKHNGAVTAIDSLYNSKA
uniref:Gustatory receptor n=1 Tax=Anopheles maculatus TaxID=74869 RepID=A0A182TC94_9DIPT